MIKKEIPKPHEALEKINKKKIDFMFSSGQYRSTEKGYK